MQITISPGTYIVAVSGGVDSMVLLDLLANKRAESREQRAEKNGRAQTSDLTPLPFQLIIAHYDHGIRNDSKADRKFVQRAAKVYGLPFTFDQGVLGRSASENVARLARYKFLEAARQAANAQAIITAHHQDDQLETAFINTLRGTGRRGLTALSSRPTLIRPLLGISKSELLAYANANNIAWRHDSTNDEAHYTRNHVRHKLLPNISQTEQDQLVQSLQELGNVNERLDTILANHLHVQNRAGELDRHWYIMLPHDVASEIMLAWLNSYGVKDLDKKRIAMLVAKSKTLEPGKHIVVNSNHRIKISKDNLALAP